MSFHIHPLLLEALALAAPGVLTIEGVRDETTLVATVADPDDEERCGYLTLEAWYFDGRIPCVAFLDRDGKKVRPTVSLKDLRLERAEERRLDRDGREL